MKLENYIIWSSGKSLFFKSLRETALRCPLKIAKFGGNRYAIGDSGGIDNDREVLIMTKVMSSKCVVGK